MPWRMTACAKVKSRSKLIRFQGLQRTLHGGYFSVQPRICGLLVSDLVKIRDLWDYVLRDWQFLQPDSGPSPEIDDISSPYYWFLGQVRGRIVFLGPGLQVNSGQIVIFLVLFALHQLQPDIEESHSGFMYSISYPLFPLLPHHPSTSTHILNLTHRALLPQDNLLFAAPYSQAR